jgi:CRISPR system Cascade subunit CasB
MKKIGLRSRSEKFINGLVSRSKKDSSMIPTLCQVFKEDNGELEKHRDAFKYILWAFSEKSGYWYCRAHFIIAGLWALKNKKTTTTKTIPFSVAVATYYKKSESESIEKRFKTILDADETQLPTRMRDMMSIVKEYPIDFISLLEDVLYWNHPSKFVQIKWCESFYSQK